jgi:hypothetical protein
MHTYCAGLMSVPEGDWHCPECAEAAAAPAESGPAANGSAPAVLDVSDEDDEGSAVAAGSRRQGTRRRRGVLASGQVPAAAGHGAAGRGAATSAVAAELTLEDSISGELTARGNPTALPAHGQSAASRCRIGYFICASERMCCRIAFPGRSVAIFT